MATEVVDGQDIDAVFESVERAVDRARSKDGPTLIEAKTYRYVGHSRSDKATYRPDGELEEWLARDPIELFAAELIRNGAINSANVEQMRHRQSELIDVAQGLALESPPSSIPQMFAHVLAPTHH
jgi:pyruvate dehydrogenase E1 component alpha subunit